MLVCPVGGGGTSRVRCEVCDRFYVRPRDFEPVVVVKQRWLLCDACECEARTQRSGLAVLPSMRAVHSVCAEVGAPLAHMNDIFI